LKLSQKIKEIREELKALSPNNENILDTVVAPVLFVLISNLFTLNIAILLTGIVIFGFLILRIFQKQNTKYVFYGAVGSLVALAFARFQGSASGFFIPGIIRDGIFSIIGISSILIGKPFTIYTSKALRKWPNNWYFHPQVKPAYVLVAYIWTIYLFLKATLQLYFFENTEILVLIKLASSNQTTLLLLVITYLIGQKKLLKLAGPSIEEFNNNTPPPWTSQQQGF